MLWLDAVATIGGLVFPPVMDFVKKKFLKPNEDTPEQTMSALATTKPEILPEYMNATVGYMKAQIDFFNRDVVGTPSQWIIDLRAAIRPIAVIATMFLIGFDGVAGYTLEPNVRAALLMNMSSWFGSRLVIQTK